MWDKKFKMFISRQVVNETCNVLQKKFDINIKDLDKVITELEQAFFIVELNGSTTRKALKINSKYKYSFWDSMIIASALENDCEILFSEDMQDKQIIEKKLQIKNPFSEK